MNRHERLIKEMDPKCVFAKVDPFEAEDYDHFPFNQCEATGEYLEDELFSFKKKRVEFANY